METSKIKPINKLTSREIQYMRDKAYEAARQAFYWMPFIRGRVSKRVENTIRRAYEQGYLTKPLNEYTVKEISYLRGIGVKSISEIQLVVNLKG